jgi:hypothetical protein
MLFDCSIGSNKRLAYIEHGLLFSIHHHSPMGQVSI